MLIACFSAPESALYHCVCHLPNECLVYLTSKVVPAVPPAQISVRMTRRPLSGSAWALKAWAYLADEMHDMETEAVLQAAQVARSKRAEQAGRADSSPHRWCLADAIVEGVHLAAA